MLRRTRAVATQHAQALNGTARFLRTALVALQRSLSEESSIMLDELKGSLDYRNFFPAKLHCHASASEVMSKVIASGESLGRDAASAVALQESVIKR